MELALDGQEHGLVAGHIEIGHAQNEGLIALVGTAIEQARRLGVGASHDDARHTHDIELEARGIEAQDLLVLRHQHLTALVSALLVARLLVFDVVSRHAHFHEAANQVAHVRVSAVSGIGVGDDERPIVEFWRGGPLFCRHTRARKVLVAVGCQQRAHDRGSLVGHLAQRIAGEVGARIFRDAALGRGRPATEIDALDAQPLDGHCLPGRIRTKGRDRLADFEQLPQAGIEGLGGLARDGIVGRDGATLLDHLTRRIKANDSLKTRAGEVLADLPHSLFLLTHHGQSTHNGLLMRRSAHSAHSARQPRGLSDWGIATPS